MLSLVKNADIEELDMLTNPIREYASSLGELTSVEKQDKLRMIISTTEAKYLADKFWKHFFG